MPRTTHPSTQRKQVPSAMRSRALRLVAIPSLLLCLGGPACGQEQEQGPRSATQHSTSNIAEVASERRPYRVRIAVAFGRDAAFTPDFRRQTLARLSHLAERTYGILWDLHTLENAAVFPANTTGLERLSADEIAERATGAGRPVRPGNANASRAPDGEERQLPAVRAPEKVFLVTIATSGAHFDIAAREWDAASGTLSMVEEATAHRRSTVAEAAFRVVRRLFRPVCAVEAAGAEEVSLGLRGGAIAPVDPTAAQLKPGDLLRPFFRYFDKEGTLQRIQTLPWTYLHVETVEGGRVSARGISGLRAPLGTSRRRRVEVHAVRVHRKPVSTRVHIVRRESPPRPLIGYEVSLVRKTFPQDEADGEPVHRLSNRNGDVEVPYDPAHPIAWVYVESGQALLARVPLVPGEHARETLVISDDSIRLAVEGELELLKSDLIDTVAVRAMILARARLLARAGKWKEADAIMERLEELPGVDKFESRLTTIRVPALEAAQHAAQAGAAARIKRLCQKSEELFARYLDTDKVRALKDEMEELRKLDEEDRKRLASP